MEEIIINIAVVEDEQQQILNYQNYLDRFQKERLRSRLITLMMGCFF